MTFHPFSPDKVKRRILEIIYEYFEFDAFCPINAQQASQQYIMKEFKDEINPAFQLIIESGHSHTCIVPFFDNEPLNYATKRLEVGGKLLTNYLKGITSFRHLDLKNEYRLINQVKEELCFTSLDFKIDMKQKFH